MKSALRALVGDEGIVADASSFAVHGVVPGAVAAPRNAEQAAAVLARAGEEGWVVEAAGNGGWLRWGRPPERLDIVVTTQRMRGVVEYEPADLTAGVHAGTPAGELADQFAGNRQMLPLDPAGWRAGTIGALIATAGAGPLRTSHGTARDQVLGVELVTGDGRVLQLGGKVVKNVAGYDLVKLVVGSRGTIGLVTSAYVRLRPIPDVDRSVAIVARDGTHRLAGLDALSATGVPPAAVELVSRGLTRRIGLDVPAWTVFARFLGGEGAVAEAERRLAPSLRSRESGLLTPEAADAVWSSLGELEATARVVLRLGHLPTQLDATLDVAERVAASDDAWIIAHAGEGIVRLLIERVDEGLAARIEQARAGLEKDGGSLVVAQGPAALMNAIDPWGDPGPQVRLMHQLKAKFDPAGILAPGRFVV